MLKLFKKSFRVIEFKNSKGKKQFCAVYASPFLLFVNLIFKLDIFIDEDGYLKDNYYGGEPTFFSLEAATNAITKYKDRKALEIASKYKRNAVYYIEEE